MLTAYFDASERQDGIFCVAGIAYGSDRTKKATRQWEKLWGETRCHMTELHTRKKGSIFYEWSPEQAGQRLKDSISIINRNASFVVAVSCDIAELNQFAPTKADPRSKILLGGFNNAYAFCCHCAMAALARLANNETDIAYFFESGDKFQSESQRFIGWLTSHPQVTLYKHRSHTVLSKLDCRLFEATDILAWEWAKHIERNRGGKTMRSSLKALLGDNLNNNVETNVISTTRRGWHVTGEPMEKYFNEAYRLGLFSD